MRVLFPIRVQVHTHHQPCLTLCSALYSCSCSRLGQSARTVRTRSTSLSTDLCYGHNYTINSLGTRSRRHRTQQGLRSYFKLRSHSTVDFIDSILYHRVLPPLWDCNHLPYLSTTILSSSFLPANSSTSVPCFRRSPLPSYSQRFTRPLLSLARRLSPSVSVSRSARARRSKSYSSTSASTLAGLYSTNPEPYSDRNTKTAYTINKCIATNTDKISSSHCRNHAKNNFCITNLIHKAASGSGPTKSMHNDNNSNNNENSRFSDNVYSDSWSTQAYETSPRRVHHRRDYYGSRNAVYSDYSSYGSLNSFGSFGSSSSSSPYSGRRYGGSRRYSNSYHARYDSRYDPFEGYEEDYDHCDGRNRRPPYVDAYSRPYYRDEEYEFEYEYNGFGEEYEEEFGVGDDVPWYRSSLRGQEGSSRSIIDGAGASGSRDDNRRNNNNSHPGSSRNLSTYAHTRSNAHTRTTYDDYGHPRRQTSSQSPSPPPPPIADCPSEEYLSIASQPSYTVNSVSSSSSSTSDTSPTTASAPRKLIILDLNGTLLVRVNRSVPHPRPYMPTFREYLLCEDTRSWLDTMVWSSAQPHNVEKMVRRCFFDERVLGEEGEGEGKSKEKEGGKGLRSFKDMWTGKLVAVWARDTLGLSRNDYSRKAKTVKDLAKVWSALSSSDSSADGTSHSHDARTTFLLDDSPDKVHLQPFNHVCIREYGVEDRERDVKIKMKELEMRDVRERELKEIEKEKEDRGEEGLSGEEADRTEKEENMLEEHSQTSTKAGVDAGTDIDTSVDPRANVDEPGSEATRDSENNEYVGGVVNMEGSEVAEELDTETDKRLQRRKEKKAKKKLEKKQKLVQGSIPSHRHEHTQKHNQEQEQKQVPSKSGCVDEHSSYDETLLAIIGILEAIKYETNVAGWIRAGGLWAASNPQIKDDLSTGTEIFVVPNHIPGRVRAESPTDAEVDEIEGLEELGELKSLEGLEGGDKVNEVRDADAADRANEIVEAPPTSSSPTPSPILKRTRPDDLPDYRIGSNGGGGERSWYLDSELPRSPSKKIRYSDPERSSSLLERIEGTGTVEAPTGNDAQTTTQVVVDMSISSSDSSSLLSSVAQPPSESTLLPFDPPAQLVHPLPQDIGEKQDPRVHKEVVSVRKAQEVETDINTQLESNNINAGNEVPTSREPPETAKMWFEDKATFDHWVSRGRSVLKEMGIKERDGIYVV